MTTQPELPEVATVPARPLLRLASAPPAPDVDFDAFFRSYEVRLRRLVMRRIGDLCDAEEITQETLLRAYQHRASFSNEDELMAWSTVVAQRLVIDRVRVRGRSVAVAEVPETARLGRDTADVVVARQEARAALESLEAIPTRQAAILWAREVEGLHYDEIAARFGITEPAVRSLLHRGRRALRAEFKNRTGSLPLNGLVPLAPWLVALKAVGKVRGAAKTAAKSPLGAVAALSLTGLVSIGIGGLGTGERGAGSVPISPYQGGTTHLTSGYEAPQAVDRAARVAIGRLHPASTALTPPRRWVTDPIDGLRKPRRCAPSVPLCTEGDQPWEGATIQLGPDLPSNPTGLRNVKISSDRITCADTHLPSSGVVSCTDNPTSPESSPRQPLDAPEPSPEGAQP